MKKILVGLMVMLGLQTQAQNNLCDSLSYTSMEGLPLMVFGSTNGLTPNMVDSIDWNFTACNAVTCYTPQGNNPYSFPLINMTDTVKLCYDAFVYWFGTTTVCNRCDSLIYDLTDSTWVVYNRMGNPTNIEELSTTEIVDNKIYDVYGRELPIAPIGQMYIQNRKKYIKINN